jgi:hypothetical protein
LVGYILPVLGSRQSGGKNLNLFRGLASESESHHRFSRKRKYGKDLILLSVLGQAMLAIKRLTEGIIEGFYTAIQIE